MASDSITCTRCGAAVGPGLARCPDCGAGVNKFGGDPTRKLRRSEAPPAGGRTPARSANLGSLGDYRLDGVIGRGGFGTVYSAQDSLGNWYALKAIELQPEMDSARLVSEFHLSRKIDDFRNVVRAFPPSVVSTSSGRVLIIPMELMGENLEKRRSAILSLPVEARERFVMQTLLPQLCHGLKVCHRAGILHLDLKPANILADATDSNYKIADFGISRVLATDAVDDTTTAALGTVRYVAPELLAGRTPTAAADIYSLGVTLCELLFGEPYVDDTIAVSAKTCALLNRCIERNPARRFQSVEELTSTLARHDSTEPSEATEDNQLPIEQSTSIQIDHPVGSKAYRDAIRLERKRLALAQRQQELEHQRWLHESGAEKENSRRFRNYLIGSAIFFLVMMSPLMFSTCFTGN